MKILGSFFCSHREKEPPHSPNPFLFLETEVVKQKVAKFDDFNLDKNMVD